MRTMSEHLRAWLTEPETDEYVDVNEVRRHREILQSETKLRADAESRVVRVSGQRKIGQRLPALVVRERMR